MELKMKKNLLGLTLASLLFTTGSAVAADYKIDKEGQHAFVNFRIQHLGLQLAVRHFQRISTVRLPLMRKIPQPIRLT